MQMETEADYRFGSLSVALSGLEAVHLLSNVQWWHCNYMLGGWDTDYLWVVSFSLKEELDLKMFVLRRNSCNTKLVLCPISNMLGSFKEESNSSGRIFSF